MNLHGEACTMAAVVEEGQLAFLAFWFGGEGGCLVLVGGAREPSEFILHNFEYYA